MGSLIEQAIIDANELREAALRSAESQIIEKYSTEIREAMDSLLDEEHDSMEMPEEQIIIAPNATIVVDDIEDIPQAGIPLDMAKPEVCPCPDDEDVEMEFSLDDLRALADQMEDGEPVEAEEEIEVADINETVETEEELDEAHCGTHKKDEELTEDMVGDSAPEEAAEAAESAAETLEEETIKAIVEELIVDITDGDFIGWAGRPEEDVKYQQTINLARLAATEKQAEFKELEAGMQKLAGIKESLEQKNTQLTKTVALLKEKLDELSLSSAKLLYQNEALLNTSLNGRQKRTIVETVRKAKSVEDAKVIYETLQSAVSTHKSRKLESLNEAIRRPSHTINRSEIKSDSAAGQEKSRFQILAGIK
jgi:hypothetical protein